MDFSHLKAEWHPTKNGDLIFSQYLHINWKYWWQGDCGHEWEASLYKRLGKREAAIAESTGKKSGCPVCSVVNTLATINPILGEEWHPTKNDQISPTQIAAKSPHKRWWICSAEHEWQDSVIARASGAGCPQCSGFELLIGINDLATVRPMFAAEWHPTKNGALIPQELTMNYDRNIWWICPEGHEWCSLIATREEGCRQCGTIKTISSQALVDVLTRFEDFPLLAAELHRTKNYLGRQIVPDSKVSIWWVCFQNHEWKDTPYIRTTKDKGCPVCSGHQCLTGYNDLTTVDPIRAGEWHPTKNGELRPEQVTLRSENKYWWICLENHEWESTTRKLLIRGTGCSLCVRQHVLANEWHHTKNELTVEQAVLNSNNPVWWSGVCNHEWKASLYSRVELGKGCPICSNLPVLAAEWHPTKNGNLTTEQIIFRENEKFWWLCDEDHEWEASLNQRTTGRTAAIVRCPFCSNKKRVILGVNDVATTHPEIAAEWHPTRNGKLTPEHITAGANNKYWWLGASCGHEWESYLSNRRKGFGCAVCSNQNVLAGFNDLATLYPVLAAEWHPNKNGELTAQQIIPGSGNKVWWLGKCGHEWETILNTRSKNGDGCPYCSGRRVLAGFNDLATLNPTLAAQWHPTKNTLTAAQVTVGSTRKIWWQCVKSHEWEARPQSRSRGGGCPKCWASTYISKAEQAIHDYILSLDENITVIQSDRKVLGKNKELDIYIPSKNIAIEYNGIHWHKEKFTEKTDHYNKWLTCRKLGIQLIQVWEDDWNRNPQQIKYMIARILGLSPERKVFAHTTTVKIVKSAVAEEFLKEHHAQGYISGSSYIGLFEKNDMETPLALLVLEENKTSNKVWNILRYAAAANVVDGFSELLFYAVDMFSPDSFVAVADNCGVDGELYKISGFSEEKILPPDFMYLYRGVRRFKSDYSMERFRSDPTLEWAEGFTENELAYLNDIDRIWDAGKTVYRL